MLLIEDRNFLVGCCVTASGGRGAESLALIYCVTTFVSILLFVINDLYKCVVCVYLPRLELTLHLWLCHQSRLDAMEHHLASTEYVNLCHSYLI